MEKLIPVTYVFGNNNLIKQSALFYDCILPFPFEIFDNKNDNLNYYNKRLNDYFSTKIYNELTYPISMFINYNFKNEYSEQLGNMVYHFDALMRTDFLQKAQLSLDLYNNKIVEKNPINHNIYQEIYGDDDKLIVKRIINKNEQMKEFGFDINYVMPSNKLCSQKATMEDISVILSGIDLIDTEKASWEQIIEYRQNENAKKKLRNLRLFLQTNYEGKSRQYIEDDFGKRIDDYNSVVKEYGFNKKKSIISFLANSKNIRTFGTASIAAILLGQPFVATGSALTGVCLEILNGTLEFISQKHAFNKFKEEHELSYIMDFNDQI